ncbi:glutathione S-transferase family protein [Jannaschia sp. Os4]|uniref:FtsZ-binding protein FzlA n=1 Tax=Jannaschia sp. Os4 TaxID=2807617 RepID=UPI001939EE90|nr:glutathione S-transferase family protein [Jannaschia sp. Os4]MBM2575635.1 glutathione S-transferase family protein [Jannaschia sp. Os4]
MIQLIHFPLSPFSRKVRLLLAEKGLQVELVEERYWEREPEFLRRNAAGKVPVLRIDGHTLSDSAAICEYLEETRPEPALLPSDPRARAEVRRLVGWFDDKFHREVTEGLVGERVMKKVMRAGHPDGTKIGRAAKAISFHLDYMDWLLDRNRWLAGREMSLADFAAAAHLSVLDYQADVDWERSQLVRQWYSAIKSRPAFRTILADVVPGFRPAPHYADLDF